jgi:membrane fusion protein, heavy metal efflux system
LISMTLMIGCNFSEKQNGSSASDGGGSVTLWTEKTELFMEYPTLVVGEEARFAVHLTWLDNFKPVTEGNVQLIFEQQSGEQVTATAEKPTSPGIFRPAIAFQQAGTYHVSMMVSGAERDTIIVGNLTVHANRDAVQEEEDPMSSEPFITFLKEQQWKIDFRTTPAVRKPLSGSVRASGEIAPKLKSEVIVSAPFTGTIYLEQNEQMPVVGTKVSAGWILATLSPSAETPGGETNFASRYVEAETERTLAEKEYERAKRLFRMQAISEKSLQEAEVAFKRAEAGYQTMRKSVTSGPESSTSKRVEGRYDFTLRSPIAGTVVETFIVPGKQVKAGDPLFRIINASSVWIKANVPVTEIGKLNNPKRASFRVPGFEEMFQLHERNGRLVSFGSVVDEKNRTIPVIFEMTNPDGKLRIGMFAEIYISSGKGVSLLAIPESALIEEEGKYSVYVHVSGESFAKRDVEVDGRDQGYVGILKGLSEGDRVVTVGAYQVRLASLSTQLPAHGHDH